MAAVGRHVAFKGHGQLIQAQALLEKQRGDQAPLLVIAGDGPLLERHRALARALGLRKLLLLDRFIGEEEKSILYSLADYCVLASTRTTAYEPWGLVCNEAAAHGKPLIISTMVGAGGEVVRHQENGLIFNDQDVAGLAGCMASLCDDAELRARFGQASLRIIAEYAPPVMIDRFESAIRQALSAGNR